MVEQDKFDRKIVIFEDLALVSEMAAIIIAGTNWNCVAIIDTMNKAVKYIEEITDKGINACLIDGNLTPSREDGGEGREIVYLLHQQNPDIATIGFSSSTQNYVRYQMGKRQLLRLPEILKQIEEETIKKRATE